MRFEVIKESKDFKLGEVFEGEWQILNETKDYIEEVIWDSKEFRGITPEKVKNIWKYEVKKCIRCDKEFVIAVDDDSKLEIYKCPKCNFIHYEMK